MRISEERFNQLPPAMTARARSAAAPKKPTTKRSRSDQDEPPPLLAPAAKSKTTGGGKAAMQALGRLAKGEMNKTEQAYADHLELLRRAGEILWFKFEPMKLQLAEKTTYSPDFLVQVKTGHLELHEVKGFWEDDARVKIKVAAEMFPIFKFIAIKKGEKGEAPWSVETFK